MQKYFCQICGSQLEKPKDKSVSSIGYCNKCEKEFYQNSKPVALVVIVKDGKILLAKRKTNVGDGKWNLPGGFLEHGELPEEAAKRETREEVGVEVEIDGFLGFETFENPYFENTMMLDCQFYGHIVSGTPQALEESSEVRWFEFDKIPYDDMVFGNNVKAIKKYLKLCARSSVD